MSDGPDLDKRVLIQTAFGASLVLLTGRGEALTGALGREGVDWLGPVEELTAALRGETLTVAEWRSRRR